MTDRQTHWQNVYTTKGENEVSWFQESPTPSLELLALTGAGPGSAIVDIGGGASRLVDALVAEGYQDVTVLDLSDAALATARSRLGSSRPGNSGTQVKWVATDITKWDPDKTYDVWHDRAAFHFLTEPSKQAAYIERLKRALRPGSHAIIGTFALDGPEKCSGLVVARHDAASLAAVLGDRFKLVYTRDHAHATPWNAIQKFQFSVFRFS